MSLSPLAETALREMCAVWQTEPAQTIRQESGLDWTPGSHRVRVRATSREIDGAERIRLSVETDFLQNVPLEDRKFCIHLGGMAPLLTSTYALVYPLAEIQKRHSWPASLTFFSSVYADAETAPSRASFLARMAIMQPIVAEETSDVATEWSAGGSPAYASGAKASSVDEMLTVAKTLYAPLGEAPSRWIDCDEFEKFAEAYGRCDACFAMGDRSGLAVETPFGGHSALTQLNTGVSHPQLQNGLLITLQLPLEYPRDRATDETAYLNFLEALGWTNFPQFGCWHPFDLGENRARVAHTGFVPNALYQPGMISAFAQWSAARATWVRQQLFPDLKDLTMAEILQARFGPSQAPMERH